jgi:hypothetical protein
MREICLPGSEGGAKLVIRPYPYQSSDITREQAQHPKQFCCGYAALGSMQASAPSPKSLGFRCVQNGPPARRSEPDWRLKAASRSTFYIPGTLGLQGSRKVGRDVTDEQRSH